MPKLIHWAACLPAFFCAAAVAADLHPIHAYVISEGSASVSTVDTQTEAVSATFKVGERPRALAVTPGGERVYVILEDGTLIERDMYAKAQSGQAKLGRLPSSINISPDGKLLAAAIQSGAEVALVELATMRIVKRIPIPDGKRPANAVFTPDGRWIYVSMEESPTLDVIDARQGTVASSIAVGPRLRDIAFTADGSRAYVTAGQQREVVVIDVARHAVLDHVGTASAPFGVVVHPDGKHAFVSAPDAGKVYVLDTTSNRVVTQVDACAGASEMALTPGGNKLYVTCGPAKEVAVIDTRTYRQLAQVPVGFAPAHVVIGEPPPPPEFERPMRARRKAS
jgi:YVTN family beta-propeller protein